MDFFENLILFGHETNSIKWELNFHYGSNSLGQLVFGKVDPRIIIFFFCTRIENCILLDDANLL